MSEQLPPEQADGFLARWSHRKALASRGIVEPEPPEAAEAAAPEPTAEEAAVKVDPRTGKPYDELTDEDMPPLETLDASSDLSVFLARNISPALRMAALGRVFASKEYNQICLCAEYAEDYTQFEPLGSVVPHDLKRAVLREAERLRERLVAEGEEISLEEAQARVADADGLAHYQVEQAPAEDELPPPAEPERADNA